MDRKPQDEPGKSSDEPKMNASDDVTDCRPLAGPDATAFGPGLVGDTSPSAARRYFSLLAAASPGHRLEMVSRLSRMVRAAALLGARQREPNLPEDQLRQRVAEFMYGRIEARFGLERNWGKTMANDDGFDAFGVALAVGEALDSLGIAYFVGGSLASSFQGEPRATNDIDVVVELRESQIAPLAQKLGPDFSVDEEGLKAAVRARRSDNIFFLPMVTKVDIFVCGRAPFDLSEMARRRRLEVQPGRHLWIKSAEDTVLRKLLWYRQGGEVSNSQWRDITSVLRISGGSMDSAYLGEWAPVLRVEDLLARARAEIA